MKRVIKGGLRGMLGHRNPEDNYEHIRNLSNSHQQGCDVGGGGQWLTQEGPYCLEKKPCVRAWDDPCRRRGGDKMPVPGEEPLGASRRGSRRL